MKLSKEEIIELYETMLKIRLFEEKVIQLFSQNKVFGNMHMYVGEEAVATGAVKALNENDLVTSTHRGHGHIIAKGGELSRIVAEIMGKETGYCKGFGGKMHLAAPELGFMGANGIVGAGIPLAAGHALYSQMFKTGQVTMCFFGDGASNHGYFHEGINLAALWKLPVVFICENNEYAISTHVSTSASCKNVADRAAAYNIPGYVVDGNDVVAVLRTAKKAVNAARAGEGPTLIECKTYRYRGHHEGDDQLYRSKDDVNEWMGKCPIKKTKELLMTKYEWSEENDEKLIAKVKSCIEEAVDSADKSKPACPEDVERYVYKSEV